MECLVWIGAGLILTFYLKGTQLRTPVQYRSLHTPSSLLLHSPAQQKFVEHWLLSVHVAWTEEGVVVTVIKRGGLVGGDDVGVGPTEPLGF
jgi:hypothetical protein